MRRVVLCLLLGACARRGPAPVVAYGTPELAKLAYVRALLAGARGDAPTRARAREVLAQVGGEDPWSRLAVATLALEDGEVPLARAAAGSAATRLYPRGTVGPPWTDTPSPARLLLWGVAGQSADACAWAGSQGASGWSLAWSRSVEEVCRSSPVAAQPPVGG